MDTAKEEAYLTLTNSSSNTAKDTGAPTVEGMAAKEEDTTKYMI